jgi:hypothetical protein
MLHVTEGLMRGRDPARAISLSSTEKKVLTAALHNFLGQRHPTGSTTLRWTTGSCSKGSAGGTDSIGEMGARGRA